MANSSGGTGRQRPAEGGILEGSWVWIALPLGILVLIASLWFLVIAPAGSSPPRATSPQGTPTRWPTVTPMAVSQPTKAPTEATVAAPAPTAPPATGGLAVGARVEVADTGVGMLRVRDVPGTDSTTLKLLPDGTQLVIVAGPEQVEDLTWWKVREQSGEVGWAAGQFLKPAP